MQRLRDFAPHFIRRTDGHADAIGLTKRMYVGIYVYTFLYIRSRRSFTTLAQLHIILYLHDQTTVGMNRRYFFQTFFFHT